MVLIRSNKGQVDQAITSVIVLFAAFFLMAIFVVVAGNIGKLLGQSEDVVSIQHSGSVYLEEVSFRGEEVFVVDVVQQIVRDETNFFTADGREVKNELESALIDLVDEHNSCLGVAWGAGDEPVLDGLKKHEGVGFYDHNLIILEYIEGEAVRSPILETNYGLEGNYRCLEFKYSPLREWHSVSLDVDGSTIYLQSFYGGCSTEKRCFE